MSIGEAKTCHQEAREGNIGSLGKGKGVGLHPLSARIEIRKLAPGLCY